MQSRFRLRRCWRSTSCSYPRSTRWPCMTRRTGLRSPLTAIRTASEGLDNPAFELTSEERHGLFEAIRIEVARLERLVDNLLDLSRLEAGPAVRKPELWTIDTLLARALEQLGVDADRVEVEPTAPHTAGSTFVFALPAADERAALLRLARGSS